MKKKCIESKLFVDASGKPTKHEKLPWYKTFYYKLYDRFFRKRMVMVKNGSSYWFYIPRDISKKK